MIVLVVISITWSERFNSKFFFQNRKKRMKTSDRVIIEHPLWVVLITNDCQVVNYYVVAQVLLWCR